MKTHRTKGSAELAAGLTSVSLIVFPAIAHGKPGNAAGPQGYTFTVVRILGDPAPGPEGGFHVNDFEPYGINDRGEVSFASDLSTGGEGVFVGAPGHIQQILRAGEAAPGGGTFGGFGVFEYAALNSGGDVACCFGLEPFPPQPIGVNSGVYRYLHSTKTLSPILIPAVTRAPGGGTFVGGDFYARINNAGAVVFTGKITGGDIDASTPPGFGGLGNGIFLADRAGHISSVMRPGDSAPGGGVFDWAECPSINDAGDIAFEAHIAGDPCPSLNPGIDPISQQFSRLGCSPSVFFKPANGPIQVIARIGEPAPGSGTYWFALTPILNSLGDFVFNSVLSPPGPLNDLNPESVATFLHTASGTIRLAGPGDAMPGGGRLLRTSVIQANVYINDRGEVVFNGVIDTDANGDGIEDTGIWVWSAGEVRLVARTGTIIQGVGTVAHLMNPFGVPPNIVPSTATSGAVINNRGQVFFQAILEDKRDVLLVATPQP